MVAINFDILTGKTEIHLADTGALSGVLHTAVVEPFQSLQADAEAAGFDLSIVSGYRGFDRQLLIWNEKARGNRLVLDDDQQPIDVFKLSDDQRLHALLRWSALPGASRHHWGTDFDIFDSKALNQAKAASDLPYALKLTVDETEPGGIFADM